MWGGWGRGRLARSGGSGWEVLGLCVVSSTTRYFVLHGSHDAQENSPLRIHLVQVQPCRAAAAGVLLTRRLRFRVMRCWSARTTAACAAGTRQRRSCGGARPAVTRGAPRLVVTRRMSSLLTPSARDSHSQRGGVHRVRALREAAVLRRRRRRRRGGRRHGGGAAEVDCGLAPAHLHRALAWCVSSLPPLVAAPLPRLRARRRRHLMIDNLYATPLIGPTPVEAMKIRYL